MTHAAQNGASSQNGSSEYSPALPDDARPVLITGGCGFIGTNLAARLLSQGKRVIVFDDLSRRGVEDNLAWLQAHGGDNLQLERADIREYSRVESCVREASAVYHFAAQVAVTTSLVEPLRGFEINARGTLNILEAMREMKDDAPPLVFTSTNKVYGELGDAAFSQTETRYEPEDAAMRAHGIGENRPLDFHSPYGCSKGAADQYVIDYARTFELPAVVFRMSCIYGPHQKGNEDQGWVAHFLLRALEDAPISIYGDGKQVRDLLFSDDLMDALIFAGTQARVLAGQAFNIGGGPHNAVSLLELLEIIGELRGVHPDVSFDAWRTGDQKYYVSDTRRFCAATGWQPQVNVREGVARLLRWFQENRASQNGANAAREYSHATAGAAA